MTSAFDSGYSTGFGVTAAAPPPNVAVVLGAPVNVAVVGAGP